MSILAESPSERNEEEEEQEEQEVEVVRPSAYHPPAPSHELFDISTTVDPSYVISLIRKLLPLAGHSDAGSCRKDGPITGGEEKSPNSLAKNGGGIPERIEVGLGDENKKGVMVGEKAWEEYGCILWDLAASKTHAELMVQNFILEVLLATLMVSKSARITEISLGIIGNLACHEISREKIAFTNELMGTIMDQLLLDDSQCLCEACRVIALCLQGGEGVVWAEEMKSERILHRLLWIVENTLNLQLMEKSMSLLLAILESKHEVTAVLLPPLMNLGLPSLLINLFTLEMAKLTEERIPERYSVLDLILRIIEALSVLDDCSQEICANKELFLLLIDLIKLPDKMEVANSCITAAVLVANILTDAAELTAGIAQDLFFLQGLFDIYPFASDDTEARNALWSILARVLVQVQESEISLSTLHQYVSVLSSASELMEEELLDNQLDGFSEKHGTSATICAKPSARVIAIRRMFDILNRWKILKDQAEETLPMENSLNEGDVDRLLLSCRKFLDRD